MKPRNKAVAIACSLMLAGCAEPQIITRTVYQEVKMPVACIEKMPAKPEFKEDDPQSAKELMGYLKTCEELLKGCVNERTGN